MEAQSTDHFTGGNDRSVAATVAARAAAAGQAKECHQPIAQMLIHNPAAFVNQTVHGQKDRLVFASVPPAQLRGS